MNIDTTHLISMISSLVDDFYALISMDYLEEESSERFESYKLTYKTTENQESTILVEFDLKREKVSFGPFGSSALTTKKLMHQEILTAAV